MRLPSAPRMASASSRLLLLQLEDLLLDRVARDQPVGEHLPGLADAVRAVDGLGLDGRVPPRVEEEDVVGRGQVEAEPAGLEADQEERAVGVGLEALDARLRGRGSGRRGTRRRCPRASRRSRTMVRRLVNCEKTSALCPSAIDLGELRGMSASSLALRSAARFGIDQAGVAGRLAQAQQRLQHVDLRSLAIPSRSSRPSSVWR